MVALTGIEPVTHISLGASSKGQIIHATRPWPTSQPLTVSAGIKHPRYCRFCRWECLPGESRRHTNAAAREQCEQSLCVWGLREAEQPKPLADRRPSCAVSRNRSIGISSMSGVRPDQFDHQVKSIGAVNHACYAARLVRRHELGVGDVVQTMNALCVVVQHQERRARPILRPRELDQLAHAR